MRKLTYWQAISEATVQCMAADPGVFVAGEGVDDDKGIYGTTRAAYERFGASRVIDLPNSENACAGIAVGAAAMGRRPLMVHSRADFMFLAMDALVNLAAKWRYMYGDQGGVPVVTRGVVGRGWGQGATHSQSPQSVFGHFPGLYAATPASPADAKGLLVQALRSETPVLLLENRGLYQVEGDVPPEPLPAPFGRGRVARSGTDVTVVAASLMVYEAQRAADLLAGQGISVEVIDVRSIRPLDDDLICESVAKTGRLVVADTSWARYGFAAEVAAVVAENVPDALRRPVRRVTPPDCPAPVSSPLEDAFHPDAGRIAAACLELVGGDRSAVPRLTGVTAGFVGPY
ncbi:alpha-ketoacid dehydrogenase subunit beta [Streptomyces sp. ISL-99]|uniref:alpha-ketoacid dehydrogenase subunit beta n=1 Tax=Streptomyces sp. ISL-99 TaxID=2819193 RepID=UPI001BE9ACD1|nr:transketolase C-terminal domain-containing protein [Streptomyces sp. ISL-99]MBT2529070.1 alpha-ketoacid dehydrogenase subunit beta [Streptomyces sp. ISL-99]